MKRRTFLGAILASPLAARLQAADDMGETQVKDAAGSRIVVVGAGAFGGWTALALQRQGADVTLVDGWGPGNSRASSGGETRVIRSAYADPLYAGMAADALRLWRHFQQQVGQQLYTRTGLLLMAQADGMAFVDRAAANLAAVGVVHERLTPEDIARRYPQIALDGVQAALFEPEAGFLLARRACAAVRDAFVAAGGSFVASHVRAPQTGDGPLKSIVLSDGTTLSADTFVFACGPWLPELFPSLLRAKLKVTRQEVYFFGEPDKAAEFRSPAMPIWADLGKRFWYGIPGVENRGFKIGDDTRGEPFDPTNGQRTATPAGIDAARAYIDRRFPGLRNAPLLESRVCQYTVTPDDHFIVDRHPQADNIWIVGGGSGHGFKHGPALGEHVADRVLGRQPVHDNLSLRRFG